MRNNKTQKFLDEDTGHWCDGKKGLSLGKSRFRKAFSVES